MATIGFLGAGNVAQALAAGWAKAGHNIQVPARNINPGGRAEPVGTRDTLVDLVERAEIVVNALPGSVSLGVIAGLAPALFGKILIDVANAVDIDESGFAISLHYAPKSLAEELQAILPHTQVVKTLNTMHVSVMADPSSLATPPLAYLSGNAQAAKGTVSKLLTDLGWRESNVVDLGDIQSARTPESFVLMIAPLVRAFGPVPFAFSVAR